jgi:hypothetical protein
MDAAAHYRHLFSLGRAEFLAAAAPAVLVRYRVAEPDSTATRTKSLAIDAEGLGETVDATRQHGKFILGATEMELYPLAKKPAALFRDRITIGRTGNNDVVIAEPSVSRLHAYVRQPVHPTDDWLVADAGSKNGSRLGDTWLEPRREAPVLPGTVVRFGDVVLTFHRSADLFELLGGDHGRR